MMMESEEGLPKQFETKEELCQDPFDQDDNNKSLLSLTSSWPLN